MKLFTWISSAASKINRENISATKSKTKAKGRSLRLLSLFFAMVCISKVSFGQLLYSQDFNYSGALTSNGWTAITTGAGTNPVSTTTGLTYVGAQGTGVGNAALVNNLGGEDVNISFANQTGNGTSVYYSCMVRVTDPAATKSGDYFLHIGTPGGATFSNFAGRIWAKITALGVNFGISNSSTASYGTTNFAKNTTYYLIVKYTINTGGNDNASLWVVSSGMPATEAAAGVPELTNATVGQDQINTIALRQGSSTTSPQTVVDGIRVGSLWADVTVGASGPVITSPLTATATVGTPFTYTITASNSPTGFSSSTLPINGLSLSGAVISGTPTTATAPGTQDVNITATNGVGSDTKVLAITVNKGNQTITGLPLSDTRTYTASLQQYTLTATGGASGLPVTYSSDNPSVATTTGTNGATVTIVGAGSANITASQAGNANYNAAPDVIQALTVNKATQTITFGALADKNDTDPNFQLTATGGGSGNPVTYVSSNTAVAIIVDGSGNPDVNGTYVDIVGAGTTTITASQAGNTNYLAATDVSQDQFVVNTSLANQTISFGPLADKTYGDASFQLTATGGGSGNPVTYVSSNTGVATISGDMVTIVGPGTTTITASQAGNGSYNPAPDVDQSLTVNVKPLTVSGAVAQDKPYDGNTTAVITGATLVGIVGTDDVTVSGGGIFDDANAGTHNVAANLSLGGADQAKYSLTQPTGLSATITPLSQTITFDALPAKFFGNADFPLTATGGASGNPVTYTSSDPLVATVTGNTVHIVGAGSTTITASQAGNTNYTAAASVDQVQVVNKANQFITFAALPNKTTADAPFTLTGTSTSGLTVSFASSNPAVASVSGTTVTIHSIGSVSITASQAGDANYNPATDVTRTFNVTAPLIAAWDFTGENTALATSAAEVFINLSSSNLLTRGAGAAASAAGNSFRTTGFQNNGIAVTNTDYFQATLSPVTGKTLSLNGITAKFAGTGTFITTGTGFVASQFAYSLDGTNFTLIGSPSQITSSTLLTSPTIDLSGISALQNVPAGTTVTIRYYASGNTTTGGWGFNSPASGDYGLAFSGYVTAGPPTATYTKRNASVCNGNDGTITVYPSGGEAPYTYSWTGTLTGGGSYTAGNVQTISGLGYGFYNVTVTDANNNTATINGIHIENAYAVYITNNGSISAACANTGSLILYGNAGIKPYTYSLDGTTYQAGNTFTSLAPGSYTAYVKDSAGCVSTKTVSVGVAAPVVVTSYARGSSSCAADGSIELYRTGGIGGYTYSLDNITYQSTNKFLNLASGTYTGYVKDSQGCLGTQTNIVVTQGAALTVTAGKSNTSTCVNDGSFQLRVTGGVAPYTYSIDGVNYQAGSSFTDLSASTYTGYVKDSKGCTGSVNVTINQNPINVSAYVVAATNCSSNNGKITLYRTGGVGPYTYSLDGNTYQASNLFTDLAPGFYTGYVKDSKTCVGEMIDIYVGPDCPPVGPKPNSRNSSVKPVKVMDKSLSVSAYPNPAATEFNLRLEGYDAGRIAVVVTDIMGRKVYQSEGNAKQLYRFGNNFKPGIYNVQVIQGNIKKTITLIKE